MGSNGNAIGIGRALLACALAAAGVACGCSPSANEPATAVEPESAQPVAGLSSGQSNDLGPVSPEMRAQIEQRLAEAGGQGVGRIASLPVRTRPPRGANNLQWLFTPPDRLAPEWQRQAWTERMAPLFYPSGHARAGQYRDEVRPDDVLVAALPIAEQSFPKEYLDQPMLHVAQKRIQPKELSAAANRLWPKRDPGSARALYEWLVAQPDDPTGLPSDLWLPTLPDDPDAITHREWLREEILRQAAEQITAQKGQTGS